MATAFCLAIFLPISSLKFSLLAQADSPLTVKPFFRTRTQKVSRCSGLDLLTFCVLVLKNGFTVTGESACASKENFNEEIGRKIARQNAVAKIWALEGYLLKERLSKNPR